MQFEVLLYIDFMLREEWFLFICCGYGVVGRADIEGFLVQFGVGIGLFFFVWIYLVSKKYVEGIGFYKRKAKYLNRFKDGIVKVKGIFKILN